MAFKLTKAQAKKLDELAQAFEAAKMALNDRLDEIASDWESEWADKSERWQGGEKGHEARERIDMVRGWVDDLPAEGEPAVEADSLL